jgi:hypothetical protein
MRLVLSILWLLAIANSLTCSLYDYSQPTVTCATACPSSTSQINNNCLLPTQYISNGNVFTCAGVTSSDRAVCCPRGNYYISSSSCLLCVGRIFNNSQSCCPADSYLDYTTSPVSCVPLTTGICSTITIASLFKICCPTGQLFNIATNQCGYSSTLNCDATYSVCCPLGQVL